MSKILKKLKKRKKGFTLVELLAVIVVLSIIALIGYSVVGDVISGTQENADKETVREYAKSVSLAKMSALANGETNIKFTSDWLKENVKMGGAPVDCYSVSDNNGTINLSGCRVNNSEEQYCYDGNDVTKCNVNGIVKLYGNSIQNGEPSPTNPIEIQSVGDRTKNLFDISIISNSYYTVENDTLQVKISSGNSSVSTSKTLRELCPDLEIGKTYVASYTIDSAADGYMSIGSYSTANFWRSGSQRTITAEDMDALVIFGAGGTGSRTVTFSNIQIEEGTTATAYQPYYEGYKIPIEASGKNLLKYPYAGGDSQTVNGITYTVQPDGSILCNGTATRTSKFYLTEEISINEYNDYILSGGYEHGSSSTYWIGLNRNGNGDLGSGFEMKNSNYDTDIICIRISEGYTADNLLIKPLLEVGTIPTEYIPYVKPITTYIFLDEPLRKIKSIKSDDTFMDYIDFSTGTIVRNVGTKIFTGEDSWTVNSNFKSGKGFYTTPPSDYATEKFAGLSNYFKLSTVKSDLLNGVVFGQYLNIVIEGNEDFDADDLNDFMKNKYDGGLPVTALYPLSTPLTESIKLPQLPNADGYTNFEVKTSVEPSDVKYFNED